MPESDHTVTDRIMRLEVLSEESDKRITRLEGEMRATIAELKLLIHSEQQELGSEIRDMRIQHAADAQRISDEIQGLREYRAAQGGYMHIITAVASFLGGGGLATAIHAWIK